MNLNKFSSAFATALLAIVPAIASANHVDFFEDGPFSLSANSAIPTTLTQTGLPTGTVLGGQRVDTLTQTSAAVGNVQAVLGQGDALGTDNNDVSVVFSGTGNNSLRGTLQFQYGQANPLNANFLDIPNSANDWDRIRVSFGAFSAPINVQVGLFSGTTGQTFTLTQSYAGGLGNLDFLYSSFNSGLGLSNDFLRDVDQASLLLSSNASSISNGAFSVTLLSFNRNGSVAPAAVTVPEPTTLLLLGAALVGMAVTTRRRKS